jgi:hypothetical protein
MLTSFVFKFATSFLWTLFCTNRFLSRHVNGVMISCVFVTKGKIYEIHTWAQERRLEISGWGMAVVNREGWCWRYRAPAAILYQYIMYWRNKTKRRSKRSMFRLQRWESVVVLSYEIPNQSGLKMGEKIEYFWATNSYISILNYSIIAIFLYYALGILFQKSWKKKILW